MKSLLRHEGQCLRLHFEDLVSFKLADRYIVFGQQIILCFVLTKLKHRSILKICHTIYDFVIYHLPFGHFRIFAFSQFRRTKVHVAFDNRCARVYTAPLNKRATDASALPKD